MLRAAPQSLNGTEPKGDRGQGSRTDSGPCRPCSPGLDQLSGSTFVSTQFPLLRTEKSCSDTGMVLMGMLPSTPLPAPQTFCTGALILRGPISIHPSPQSVASSDTGAASPPPPLPISHLPGELPPTEVSLHGKSDETVARFQGPLCYWADHTPGVRGGQWLEVFRDTQGWVVVGRTSDQTWSGGDTMCSRVKHEEGQQETVIPRFVTSGTERTSEEMERSTHRRPSLPAVSRASLLAPLSPTTHPKWTDMCPHTGRPCSWAPYQSPASPTHQLPDLPPHTGAPISPTWQEVGQTWGGGGKTGDKKGEARAAAGSLPPHPSCACPQTGDWWWPPGWGGLLLGERSPSPRL